MERNGGSGKQWDCRHWCGSFHIFEGEIWSCGVHRHTKILKVRLAGLFTLFTIILNLLLSERRIYLSWHENKINADKGFSLSFCLSLITNSNLKLKTIYMISNCNTHNGIFTLSYVSVLDINSTHYAIIFKRRNYGGLLISP